MKPRTYRDMHLLNEVTQKPDVTQRELSKRIGVALGMTNLMLYRLVKKGYIKISSTNRSRIRYLITPKGLIEKTRLTYEFIQYSLQLYGRVRQSLREQLAILAETKNRRVLLYGTGELAEIAFLSIQEIGLELIGVAAETPTCERFLGHPVQSITEVTSTAFDRIIITSLRDGEAELHRLVELGISPPQMILLPIPGMHAPSTDSLYHSESSLTSTIMGPVPQPVETA